MIKYKERKNPQKNYFKTKINEKNRKIVKKWKKKKIRKQKCRLGSKKMSNGLGQSVCHSRYHFDSNSTSRIRKWSAAIPILLVVTKKDINLNDPSELSGKQN